MRRILLGLNLIEMFKLDMLGSPEELSERWEGSVELNILGLLSLSFSFFALLLPTSPSRYLY